MQNDKKHQFMPIDKREVHYRAVENGEFNCYQCNAQLYSGWRVCYECSVPLTEGTAEEMQLAADTPKQREHYENLLTGGMAKYRSARSKTNVERANFERTVDEKVKENAKAQAKAKASNWNRTAPYQKVEERVVHDGRLKRQFKHLVPTTGLSVVFRDMPTPDLAKHMNARALCDRADLILKFGFQSHEECYWKSGEYRIRCDQAGGKDGCIGPKFYVELTVTVNNLYNGQAAVYAFDVLATDNGKVDFPNHLYRIRDHNAAAEQEKLAASTRKRAGSAGPKEAAKSSRVASRQPVDGAAASSSTAPASKNSGQRTAKQYRDNTQRVQDASSMDDVRAVLASVRAPSGPTPLKTPPSKRALSQSQSAPAAKAVTPWRAKQSQASSPWGGDQVAYRQPDDAQSRYVYLYRDGDDTGSASDPWKNWQASSSWKDKKW